MERSTVIADEQIEIGNDAADETADHGANPNGATLLITAAIESPIVTCVGAIMIRGFVAVGTVLVETTVRSTSTIVRQKPFASVDSPCGYHAMRPDRHRGSRFGCSLVARKAGSHHCREYWPTNISGDAE